MIVLILSDVPRGVFLGDSPIIGVVGVHCPVTKGIDGSRLIAIEVNIVIRHPTARIGRLHDPSGRVVNSSGGAERTCSGNESALAVPGGCRRDVDQHARETLRADHVRRIGVVDRVRAVEGVAG